MRISDEELARLEGLARIALDPEERDSLRDDLGAVLEYFATINELDTDGVEEMVRPVPLANVLREDEVHDSLPRETALGLAVETEDGFFKVPRTVDGDG
ncbi:MAG: Asp-tRNA(Asn)/Glu-tRNA(Gln) amidotransferase subunit GatC [Trueperaceae bacterium]